MEHRLAEHLRRVGQADANLRNSGKDPEPFMLIYSFGPTATIKHPAWDGSWPTPTAEDVDDLAELELVRIDPETNVKRLFSLTVKGREQAAVLADPPRTYVGGRSPGLNHVLGWLREQEQKAPENLEAPGRLVPAAVTADLIDEAGREALASRILDLREQGYLAGAVPDLEQATDEQRLQFSDGLRLTMKAHDRAKPAPTGGNTVNFHGSVVAGQIAAGDITNYVSFADMLDRAVEEITALDQIDEGEREEALSLIEVLRGKAANLSADVLTGAGGALLATVLAQLLGLPPIV